MAETSGVSREGMSLVMKDGFQNLVAAGHTVEAVLYLAGPAPDWLNVEADFALWTGAIANLVDVDWSDPSVDVVTGNLVQVTGVKQLENVGPGDVTILGLVVRAGSPADMKLCFSTEFDTPIDLPEGSSLFRAFAYQLGICV